MSCVVVQGGGVVWDCGCVLGGRLLLGVGVRVAVEGQLLEVCVRLSLVVVLS